MAHVVCHWHGLCNMNPNGCKVLVQYMEPTKAFNYGHSTNHNGASFDASPMKLENKTFDETQRELNAYGVPCQDLACPQRQAEVGIV